MDDWEVDDIFFDTDELNDFGFCFVDEDELEAPSPAHWLDTSLNRNYDFFGFIASGLRRANDNALELRGVPKDASPEVMDHHESWGIDAHSDTTMTLSELKQHHF